MSSEGYENKHVPTETSVDVKYHQPEVKIGI
jgi:hypothetical protein